jgi:sugar O-acyltransferase (sialic acid O-acetyltransferase NeuD family)
VKRLVIIGAGGHGREALDIVEAINAVHPTFEFLGFLDDGRRSGERAAPHDAAVIGGIDRLHELDAAYVPAIGATAVRRRIVEQLADFESVDLIHPLASIGSHVRHGPGLIMAAGARLTHGIDLGKHVHVNVNATVSHDCRIGDFVTITPGAHLSGAVTLGDGVWLGVGCSVIQGVSVGAGVTVGAGAAVVDELPPGCTAVGVPARPLDPTSEER